MSNKCQIISDTLMYIEGAKCEVAPPLGEINILTEEGVIFISTLRKEGANSHG